MKPEKKNQAKKSKSPKAGNVNLPKESIVKSSETDNSEILENFTLELKWCLQQLEIALASKDIKNPRKVEDMNKCYRVLSSAKHPMVKKRQVMKSYFGDYRNHMAKEEQKFKYGPPKVKEKSEIPSSSTFIKKSSTKKELSSVPKENFAFNFIIDS